MKATAKAKAIFCNTENKKQRTAIVFRLFPTNHPYRFVRIYSFFIAGLFKVSIFLFCPIKNIFLFT